MWFPEAHESVRRLNATSADRESGRDWGTNYGRNSREKEVE